LARQSLRASFDVSHWTHVPAHQRVRSQEVLSVVSNGDFSLSFGLPSPEKAPAAAVAAAGNDATDPELCVLGASMPPPVSSAVRGAALSFGTTPPKHLDPQARPAEHCKPQEEVTPDDGADKALLLST
jgi:hypothetical protein